MKELASEAVVNSETGTLVKIKETVTLRPTPKLSESIHLNLDYTILYSISGTDDIKVCFLYESFKLYLLKPLDPDLW